MLPHVLFPYPAATLEFRLCTLSNFSHCENKGIKAIRGQGRKHRWSGGVDSTGREELDPQCQRLVALGMLWLSEGWGSPELGLDLGFHSHGKQAWHPYSPSFHSNRHAPIITQGSWEHANTGRSYLTHMSTQFHTSKTKIYLFLAFVFLTFMEFNIWRIKSQSLF